MPYNDPPWHPITKPIDLKHLGKLGEECGELSAIVSRCIIQGLDGINPDTKEINRHNLEEEIADVLANIYLVLDHFRLDENSIGIRRRGKIKKLLTWHNNLKG